MKYLVALFSTALSCFFLAANASAATLTIDEATDAGGDFGATVTDLFVLPVGTTTVTGVSDGEADGDLLRFTLGANALVNITLDFITGDANLLLFNAAGNPIEGDDDGNCEILRNCFPAPGPTRWDSYISVFLGAGDYLIGVGANNLAGFDASGAEIMDNDDGNCAIIGNSCDNPLGVLAFIGPEGSAPPAAGSANDYILTIETDTSVVPLPAAAWVFLAGIAGLIGVGRRKTMLR